MADCPFLRAVHADDHETVDKLLAGEAPAVKRVLIEAARSGATSSRDLVERIVLVAKDSA